LKRFPEANLRLAALLASLVVIVLAGYLVRQAVSDRIVEAFHWVDHTQQVRVTLYELNSNLNHRHMFLVTGYQW
jgi:hypothetical protein